MNIDSYMEKLHVGLQSNPTSTLHQYRGPCPFCGGTDRFLASAPTDKYPRGGYSCRPGKGCGRHGNLVDLVMELEKCDEVTACSIIGVRPPRSYSKEERRQYAIAKKYGLDIASAADEPEAVPVKAFKLKEWSPAVVRILQDCDASYDHFPLRHKKYLTDHGFNADSVAAFGIRSRIQGRKYSAAELGLPEHYGDVYAPAGVYFPLRDIHGTLFGVKVRQFGREAKYIEVTRGYRPCAFTRPYRANLPMIVVESENDALLLDSVFGDAINIFAIGGVNNAFDPATEKAVRECPWFIIALDADASGQEQAHRMQELYPDSHIAIIPACCKDPSEAYALGCDLRLWLMSSLPPVLQSRTKAILGLDYPDDVMTKISMTWKVRHAINTDSIAMLPTQESLASELEKLPAATPVALMFPPHGPWNIAFDGGLFNLDSALAEAKGYDLRPFDLTYITRDPYASQKQLSLLHIEDKVIGSVKALEQYGAHKDKQGHARTFHPDMSSAYGLLTAHRMFGKRFASPVTSFVRQLEQARPFVVNPTGLPYDRKAYADLLKTWAENEALKGKVSQYRNADRLGKGVLPVNYTEFGTVTGRYTTHDPNTQGIDHRMRDTVFALDGWQYTSIDFHMVQPRLIAAVCGDETFREPFLLGQDYYKFWIRKVLGYDGDITKTMRNFFKVPSLALLYGMGSGTFVDDLLKKAATASIPEIDALNLDADKLSNVYDNFWKTFPKLAEWDAENKAQARKTGSARTLSGRPMPLEINEGRCNDSVATCYFAQGTEAEIMLDAIIAFGQQVRAEGMKAYIALCLHDALRFCSMTAKMATEPCLIADREKLQAFIDRLDRKTAESMEGLSHLFQFGSTEDFLKALRSNDSFISMMRKLGVEAPMKVSIPKTKRAMEECWDRNEPTSWKKSRVFVPALSKTDQEFVALLDSDDENVAALVSARLEQFGSGPLSRAENIITVGGDGTPIPVQLAAFKAHTSRYAAGNSEGKSDGLNFQNFPKRNKDMKELRKCLVSPEGHVFLSCDSSQIEARMLAFVAREKHLLEDFRNGRDPYSDLAASIFKVDADTIRKNKDKDPRMKMYRNVGKTAILSAGYGVGSGQFSKMLWLQGARLGDDLKNHQRQAEFSLAIYRKYHPHIVKMWADMENALKLLSHGRTFEYGGPTGKLFTFGPMPMPGTDELVPSVLMPSGFMLRYPGLRYEKQPFFW